MDQVVAAFCIGVVGGGGLVAFWHRYLLIDAKAKLRDAQAAMSRAIRINRDSQKRQEEVAEMLREVRSRIFR